MMIGALKPPLRRIRTASRPSTSGRPTSMITRSTWLDLAACTPLAPFSTAIDSNSSCNASCSTSASRSSGSSSTIRILRTLVIDQGSGTVWAASVANIRGTLSYELRKSQGHYNSMIPVPLFEPEVHKSGSRYWVCADLRFGARASVARSRAFGGKRASGSCCPYDPPASAGCKGINHAAHRIIAASCAHAAGQQDARRPPRGAYRHTGRAWPHRHPRQQTGGRRRDPARAVPFEAIVVAGGSQPAAPHLPAHAADRPSHRLVRRCLRPPLQPAV